MRSPDAWAGAVDGIAAEGSRQPPILHAAEVSLSGNRRRTVARLVAACALLLLVVVCGGVLRPQATATDFAQKNLAPCLAHLFGTDWMGRDMLARTVTGLSTSVWVGLAASVCSGAIALVLALVSALGGQTADAVVGWLIDLVMGVPHMVLLILVSYGLGRGFWGVTLAVALTHWGSLARVLRAEAIQIRDQPYLRLAQAAGASRSRIAFAHVMPAVLPQLIVGLVVAFPHAILHEASITFLGFGLGADEPAIGVILSEAMQYLSMGYWRLAVLPGLALVAVVLVFDRLGSSLRDLVAPDSTQA